MITVKMWKKINSFEPIKDDVLDVDGTINIIAEIKNQSVEQVEEMAMEDLLPTFLDCVSEVNKTVFSKLSKLPKNATGDNVEV